MVSQIERSELAAQLIKSKENEAEKKWCAGSCLLSPASLLLEFKKLYRKRYLNAAVFNGNPLQTIEEAAEIPPLLEENDGNVELNLDRKNEQNDACTGSDDPNAFSSSDDNLSSSDEGDEDDNDEDDDNDYESHVGFNEDCGLALDCGASETRLYDLDLFSPSASLISHFESCIKEEAAQRIQRWYRTLLQRRSFLKTRAAVLTLQHWYRHSACDTTSTQR